MSKAIRWLVVGNIQTVRWLSLSSTHSVLSERHSLFLLILYGSDTQVAHPEPCKYLGERVSKAWLYSKQLLSDSVEIMGRKGQLHLRKHSTPVLAKGSENALSFIDWVSVAGRLPPSKAWYSCPLREPAWKGYRSYWVIRTCQHLGYAGWFNPIMWMEPVIVLMKSTPVSKGPWMIFCSFSVYM